MMERDRFRTVYEGWRDRIRTAISARPPGTGGAEEAPWALIGIKRRGAVLARRLWNDLSTPRPELGFGGLVPGDRWCLCASRWQEALEAGVAPPVVLEGTHALALEFSSLESLREYAVEG